MPYSDRVLDTSPKALLQNQDLNRDLLFLLKSFPGLLLKDLDDVHL